MRNRKKLLDKSICLILENSNKEDDIKVYYGKVLKDKTGSYYFTDNSSTIHLTLDEEDLTVVSEDQEKISWLVDILGRSISGYNPFDYIEDQDELDEEEE